MSGDAEPGAPAGASRVWLRWGGGLLLALVLLALAGLVRGPASTVEAIREAGLRRDREALARMVDYDALRRSLGRMLVQQMGAALPDDRGSDRELAKQFFLSGRLAQSLVESLVTPEGLVALSVGTVSPRLPPDARSAPPPLETRWQDPLHAEVRVLVVRGSTTLVLQMSRSGLAWRLIGVRAERALDRAAPGSPPAAAASS